MDAKKHADEVITRLKLLLNAKSDKALSRHFGLGDTTITSKRQRGSVPYDEAVQAALQHRNVSLDWLILGRGEPPKPDVQVALEQIAEVPMAYNHSPQSEFAEIPLYDIEAAAGDGRLFDQEKVVGHLPYRHEELIREGLNESQLVALKVKGDSMHPTLCDGDTVIVNRGHRFPDGVFLVRVGDALRIKRVQKLLAGALRLSSDNEHYAPEIISPDQVDGFEIIGSVYSRSGRVF